MYKGTSPLIPLLIRRGKLGEVIKEYYKENIKC